MKRRNVLIGAGALASSSAAAIGTGAFTSVSADRQVSVEVAGDNSALLRMTPVVHKIAGSNPALVHQNSDGTLDVDVTAGGAEGVNVDAVTWIGTEYWNDQSRGWVYVENDYYIDWVGDHTYTPKAAFGIENRGTQEYELKLDYTASGAGDSVIKFHVYEGAAPTYNGPAEYGYVSNEPNSAGPAGQLGSNGELVVPTGNGRPDFDLGKRIFVSIEIDTTASGASSNDDLSGTLSITAETP